MDVNAYLLPLGALSCSAGPRATATAAGGCSSPAPACSWRPPCSAASAPTLGVLLLGRALQGVAAALLMPNSLAPARRRLRGEARGRAIGTWAGSARRGRRSGPLLGGWLVDAVGWRAIFLINLPLAAAAIGLASAYVPESRDERAHGRPLDWIGAAAVTARPGAAHLGPDRRGRPARTRGPDARRPGARQALLAAFLDGRSAAARTR